jgi:hypothetical protein
MPRPPMTAAASHGVATVRAWKRRARWVAAPSGFQQRGGGSRPSPQAARGRTSHPTDTSRFNLAAALALLSRLPNPNLLPGKWDSRAGEHPSTKDSGLGFDHVALVHVCRSRQRAWSSRRQPTTLSPSQSPAEHSSRCWVSQELLRKSAENKAKNDKER